MDKYFSFGNRNERFAPFLFNLDFSNDLRHFIKFVLSNSFEDLDALKIMCF